MKWNDNGRGYLRTSCRQPGTRKTYTVTQHRVVAEALIPNPEGKEDVNHLDGNRANNHPSNLEWATRSENMKHAWDTGLLQSSAAHKESSRRRIAEIAKTYPRDKGGRCAPINPR